MEESSAAEFTFVGTAPYISFAAVLLLLVAIGFVIYAAGTNLNARSQLGAAQDQLANTSFVPRGESA